MDYHYTQYLCWVEHFEMRRMYKIDEAIKTKVKEAKQKEKFMKGKTYAYKLYKGWLLNGIERQGKCRVLERKYVEDFKCDVLRVIDLDTKEIFYGNQYSLKLKEEAK